MPRLLSPAAGFVGAGKVWMPPGYIDAPALVQFLDDLRSQAANTGDRREATFRRNPLVGSVETVRERLLAEQAQVVAEEIECVDECVHLG